MENSKKPVKGFKTVDRTPADYPDCDVMLVADVYFFNGIAEKLKKLQVSFPFYNAAEYIKSLPAGSSDGMQKIKDKIQSLAQELEDIKNKRDNLYSEVAELTVANTELSKANANLVAKNTELEAEKAELSKANANLVAKNTELEAEKAELSEANAKLATENKKTLSNLNKVQVELNSTAGELQSIKNSLSFKLARASTFIPRKICDTFKRKK